MQKQDRSKLKRIGVDILGIILIIGAGLTAPIPGPGGIPLLILGLSLLATNHKWAENILLRVKAHGVNISSKLFSENPKIRWAIDLISIGLIALAVILAMNVTRSIFLTATLSMTVIGLFLFFGNRKRWENIKRRFKKA